MLIRIDRAAWIITAAAAAPAGATTKPVDELGFRADAANVAVLHDRGTTLDVPAATAVFYFNRDLASPVCLANGINGFMWQPGTTISGEVAISTLNIGDLSEDAILSGNLGAYGRNAPAGAFVLADAMEI